VTETELYRPITEEDVARLTPIQTVRRKPIRHIWRNVVADTADSPLFFEQLSDIEQASVHNAAKAQSVKVTITKFVEGYVVRRR